MTTSSKTQRASHTDGVMLQMDNSPAYDLLQSLRFATLSRKKGRWGAWAERVEGEMPATEWKGIRRWFGGNLSVGTAYTALIPLLPHPHSIEELLHMVATLPLADFLRIAVTAGPTNPETPLDVRTLLGLQENRTKAQLFVDRYLRLTGQQRNHLLRILTDPETARAELLELLQLYTERIYAQIEPQVRDERTHAANRLQELVQTQHASLLEWLSRVYDVQSFTPVVLAPSAFCDMDVSVYAHEIHQSLVNGSDFEPLILIIGTQHALFTAAQPIHALALPAAFSDPAEQWSSVFNVLADPSRLRLLHLLAERPHYEQELATKLNISGATISHHINLLVRAGLVRLERQAHRTYLVLQAEILIAQLHESQSYVLGESFLDSEKEPGV